MTMNEYFYQIIVPNENMVRVRKLTPQSTDPEQTTGKLNLTKINDKIREIIKAPANLEGQKITKVGEALFEALFDGQLREDFLAYYQEIVKKKQQILEVILEINEEAMPEVVAYPWELMCLPQKYNQGEIYFATDRKLTFYRCRYQLEESKKLSIKINQGEQLKIALVVSKPTGDSQLSNVEYQEVQQYLKLVDSQQEQVKFLSVMDSLNFYSIVERLEAEKPDIFHFIGHGQLVEKEGEEVGQVAFVNEFGEADWKDARMFGQLFSGHTPKIVILQACETGRQSETNAFSSVASRLMLQGIPIVVAMQYKVSNQTAITFVKEFYSKVIEGNSVEMAVQKARFKLGTENRYEQRDFAIPVVYMNALDGYLFTSEPNSVPIDDPNQHEEVPVPSNPLWDRFKELGIIKVALVAISSISISFFIWQIILLFFEIPPVNDRPILVNPKLLEERKKSLKTDENNPLDIDLSSLYKDPDTNQEMENTSLEIKISKPEDQYGKEHGKVKIGSMEDDICESTDKEIEYDKYVNFNPEKSCIQYEPTKTYFDDIRRNSGTDEVRKVGLDYTISDQGTQQQLSVIDHPEKLIIDVKLINDPPECEKIEKIVLQVDSSDTLIPLECQDSDSEKFRIEFDQENKPDWIFIKVVGKNQYKLEIFPDYNYLGDHTFYLVAKDDRKESEQFAVNAVNIEVQRKVQRKGQTYIDDPKNNYLLKDTTDEDYRIYREWTWNQETRGQCYSPNMYTYLNDYRTNGGEPNSGEQIKRLECADKVTYYSIVERLGYPPLTILEAPQIGGLECKDLKIINYYWDKNTNERFSLQLQKDFLRKKIEENNRKLENIDYVNWAGELGWLWLGKQSKWEQEQQDWNNYEKWFDDSKRSCEERYDNEKCIISYANKIYDKLGEEEIQLPLGGMFTAYSYDAELYPLTLAEVKAHAKSLLKCKLTKNDIKYEYDYESEQWNKTSN